MLALLAGLQGIMQPMTNLEPSCSRMLIEFHVRIVDWNWFDLKPLVDAQTSTKTLPHPQPCETNHDMRHPVLYSGYGIYIYILYNIATDI